MLYSIENDCFVRDFPHKKDYARWRARLSDAEYRAIVDALGERIEGTEIQTSSWIPGADWSGTVFQPIYENACSEDERAAARFFGLLVWEVFLNHPDTWSFGRYEKDGIPIEGLTYFKIRKPTRMRNC